MPFDGIFTCCVINELSILNNCRVDKVHQPAKDEIVLFFKKDKRNIKLLLCVNPSYPRVHITEKARENPQTAPSFCMVLRKHLIGGRISEISQVNFDRIVQFKIESRDELGYTADYYLVIEIMGKHSNIILMDNSKKIIDSLKHLDCTMNRFREVIPGADYILPPSQGKINPLSIDKNELVNIFFENPALTPDKLLSSKFFGISKVFSEEICKSYAGTKIIDLKKQDIDFVISEFIYYLTKIKIGDFTPYMFNNGNEMSDYYILPLNTYRHLNLIKFENTGALLDAFYGERDMKATLKQKYNDIFKLISNLVERSNKKIELYNNKIDECSSYEKWKIYGDLIMANQYIIRGSLDSVEVENFYDPDYKQILIPLDSELSAIENAQKYYHKYSKEKSTIENVNRQLAESKEELIYFESVLYNLENAVDIDTVEEIKRELFEAGYIKKKRNTSKQQKSQPLHFRSSDGFDIYVGKNNNQNDFLTIKFAVASDIWMHTKNIPGSHVIIKSRNGYVSDTALLDGAALGAYHSKAKDSANVPVDYTERKNVKKPIGSKPGMVIYYTNKTIYVTPDKTKIDKIQVVADR
jgi:predicted ribosome quality control (RQC) complex YloA/Tae2 family protein